MQVINNSPDKATITTEGIKHVIDFGEIAKNSDASVEILLTGNKLSNVQAISTCSCTTGVPKIIDENTVRISAKYKNTHQTDPFSKTIVLNFSENGVEKREELKLKGTVV